MFFEPLSKSSRGFTNVFLVTLHPVTLVSVNDSTFFWIASWSLGAIRRFLIVFPPLKYTCTPYSLHVFFILSLIPWY